MSRPSLVDFLQSCPEFEMPPREQTTGRESDNLKELVDDLQREQPSTPDELAREIAAFGKARPVLDPRTPEEILGYDEHGLPGDAP